MILKNMTRDEIVRDVLKDLEYVDKKIHYLSQEFGTIVKRTTRFPVQKWYEYVTKQGRYNTWNICFRAEKRSDWEHPFLLYFCRYQNPEGIGVITPSIDGRRLLFYTPHFFYRYAERMHRQDENILDVVREFLLKHAKAYPQIKCSQCKFLSENSRYADKFKNNVCIFYEEGVGIFDNSDNGRSTVITFISYDMLFENQKDIVDFQREKQKGNIELLNKIFQENGALIL